MKLTENQIETLYLEREKIERFCQPPLKTVAEIEAENWKKKALERKAVIDKILTDHFFPNPHEEGTRRKEEGGFAVMLKTELKRTFDEAAIDNVLTELPPHYKELLVNYKPTLKLKEYKELPEDNKKKFENCLVITPGANRFEIVKLDSNQ